MDLYFCTTSNGLYKNAKGVFQAGIGDSFWSHVAGEYSGKITNKELIPLFKRVEHVDNLQQILWQKLVINCAINPLTAIDNVNNGALAADKYTQNINEIIGETIAVAKKVNVELDFESTRNKVYQVIQSTGANYSSMYQDINANKKTEIDFITGYIVKLAKQFDVATPMSDLLYQQVQTL
jgi:2-dehydropantoate 2-reductase